MYIISMNKTKGVARIQVTLDNLLHMSDIFALDVLLITHVVNSVLDEEAANFTKTSIKRANRARRLCTIFPQNDLLLQESRVLELHCIWHVGIMS